MICGEEITTGDEEATLHMAVGCLWCSTIGHVWQVVMLSECDGIIFALMMMESNMCTPPFTVFTALCNIAKW